jgi:hypothetical protein
VWFSSKDLILDLIVFSIFLLEHVLDLSNLFSCCSYFGLVSAVRSGDWVLPAADFLLLDCLTRGEQQPRFSFLIGSSRSRPHRSVRVSSSCAQVPIFFFYGQSSYS